MTESEINMNDFGMLLLLSMIKEIDNGILKYKLFASGNLKENPKINFHMGEDVHCINWEIYQINARCTSN